MSDGIFQRSDAFLDGQAVSTESSGRNWGEIGIGLAAAYALVGLGLAGMWAVWVVAEALL